MKKWFISILLFVLLTASMLLITGCPRVQNKVPTVIKVSGSSGTITQSSTTFSWTGNDSDGTITKYEYRKDEGSWVSNGASTSYTWSGYSIGEHTFEVRAQDDEGAYSNIIVWSFTYYEENQHPTITIVSGPSGTISQSSSTFSWNGSDSDGTIDRYEYRKDSDSWVSNGTSTSYTWNDYSEGPHTFEVRARDNKGAYSTPVQWTFAFIFADFSWQELRNAAYYSGGLLSCSSEENQIEEGMFVKMLTSSGKYGYINIISNEDEIVFDLLIYQNEVQSIFTGNVTLTVGNSMDLDSDGRDDILWEEIDRTGNLAMTSFRVNQFQGMRYLEFIYNHESSIGALFSYEVVTSSGIINFNPTDGSIVASSENYELYEGEGATEEQVAFGLTETLPAFQAGDIIVDHKTKWLRKVVSSPEYYSDHVVIQTEEASLDEAFPDLKIDFSGRLSELEQAFNMQEEEFEGIYCQEEVTLVKNEDALVKLLFYMGFNPEIVINKNEDESLPNKIGFSGELKASAELLANFATEYKASGETPNFFILTVPFAIGPVPIEIVVNMYAGYEFEASANGQANLGSEFTMVTEFGVENRDGWGLYENTQTKMEMTEPEYSIEGSVRFKPYVKVEFGMIVAFVFGVHTGISPYLEAEGNASMTSEEELQVNMGLDLGIEGDLYLKLGRGIVSLTIPGGDPWKLFDLRYTIWEASFGWPAMPRNLSIADVTSESLRLNWEDRSEIESGYELWRKTTGDFSLVADLVPNKETYTDTNLTEGAKYTYKLRAYSSLPGDIFRIHSAWSNEIVGTPSENSPPLVTKVSGPNGEISESSSTFTWTGSDSDGTIVKYEYRKDGGTWTSNGTSKSYTWSDYSKGDHKFEVRAQDNKGAYSEIIYWDFNYQEENTPPTVTKVSGPNGEISESSSTFTWTGSDSDGTIVKYEYRKDGGTWTSNGTSKSYTWSDYSKGDHKFEVRAQDNEGAYSNIIVWSFTYYEENQHPTITIVSGPSGTISQSSSTFTWTGSDPDGTITKYEYRKDGGTWTSNGTSKSYTWSDYLKGDHKFEVRAQDDEGDYSNIISWSFTYSTGTIVVGEMVLVDGGTFMMGDTWGDGRQNELPVHEVTLSYDFFVGKYEVTFEEYDAFCDATGKSKPSDNGWGRGTRPVINIYWKDAVAYCNWLSEKNNLPKAYDSNGNLLDASGNETTDITKVVGYRLLTEAEWEYAARGGKESMGYKYSGSNTASDVAWYSENSGGKTHEVGTKLPNELGIYDMSGNVWEWCSDWYSSNYYSTSPSINPYNHTSSSRRVERCSGWREGIGGVKVSNRYGESPSTYRYSDLGFRVARTAIASSSAESMPTARSWLAAVNIADRIMVIGGGNRLITTPYANNEIYNQITNTWETLIPMPTPRYALAAVEYSGKVYVFGGQQIFGNALPVNKVEIYDPVTDSWSTGSPMPKAMCELAAATCGDKIYVIAGLNYSTRYNTLQIYSPGTDSWSVGAPVPKAFSQHAAVGYGGKVYVFGGMDNSRKRLDTVYIYDPQTNSWSSGTPAPTARSEIAAVVIGSKIYIFGGVVSDSTQALTIVEVYDPLGDSWESSDPTLLGRSGLAASSVGSYIYVIGGYIPGNPVIELDSVEAYSTERSLISVFQSWILRNCI